MTQYFISHIWKQKFPTLQIRCDLKREAKRKKIIIMLLFYLHKWNYHQTYKLCVFYNVWTNPLYIFKENKFQLYFVLQNLQLFKKKYLNKKFHIKSNLAKRKKKFVSWHMSARNNKDKMYSIKLELLLLLFCSERN